MGLAKPWSMFKHITSASCALLFLGALLDGFGFARADNPIIQTIYTADPAPFIYDDRLYLVTDHDEDGSTTYNMKDWHLYSTADMANWQDHGNGDESEHV